jgi:23S rRNA pseudouridine1911/1915/1917 synthase
VAVRGRIRYRGTIREARTEYRLLRKIEIMDNYGDMITYSLAAVRIYTGRTHQIRVHMRAIGYPVVGDKLYGPRKTHNKFAHQFLHAQSLSFTFDDKEYAFVAPLPIDWQEIIG